MMHTENVSSSVMDFKLVSAEGSRWLGFARSRAKFSLAVRSRLSQFCYSGGSEILFGVVRKMALFKPSLVTRPL